MKLNIDKTIHAADIVDAMRLRQGEKGQTLTFTLYDGENAYTPPVGGSVWLKVKHADGNFAIKQGTWSSNTVSIVTDTALTAVAGRCLHAYIDVRNVDNTIVATTGDIPMVILAAADLSGQQSEHYVPIIDEVVGDLDSMTAAATSLPAGSEPTAQLDKSADPWTMRFGIPKGQAATIDVGETSTGEPGTDADVENVGTATDAVFNFTIPKGAKGDKGDQGDPGNYTKPATGIPKSDLAIGVQDALIPAGGITIDELAQAVADRLLIAGGAEGQALLKNSEDDYDAVWGDVVKKSGDTITGDLSIDKEKPHLNVHDSILDQFTNPSSNYTQGGIQLYDRNNKLVGKFGTNHLTDGEIRQRMTALREVDGNQVFNEFSIGVSQAGESTYNVTNPSAFRDAIDAMRGTHVKIPDSVINAITTNSGFTKVDYYGYVFGSRLYFLYMNVRNTNALTANTTYLPFTFPTQLKGLMGFGISIRTSVVCLTVPGAGNAQFRSPNAIAASSDMGFYIVGVSSTDIV